MKDATTILQIGGELFRLDGTRITSIESVTEVKGDKWIVTEFDGAVPRLLAVDAAMEHSEFVIEKRLRDIGELEGVGRVLSHHKRKLGPNSSEVFFTAVPADLFNTFVTSEQVDNSHQLVFSFNTLLALAVDRARPTRPMAALIEHGPNVSLLVADKRVIYGADRITSFETNDKAALLEGLTNALRSIEQNSHIKIGAIDYFRWLSIDGDSTEWLDSLAVSMDATLHRSTEKAVEIDNQRATSSLLGLLNALTWDRSSSDPEIKNRYRAKKLMPLTAIILGGLCAASLMIGLFFQGKAMGSNSDIKAIQASIASSAKARNAMEMAIEREGDQRMIDLALSGPLLMAESLRGASKTPSLVKILSDISSAAKGQVGFDQFKVTFPENRIALKLEGRIASASENGMQHYNEFIAGLANKGYSVVSSKIDTKEDALTLSLELERGIREK